MAYCDRTSHGRYKDVNTVLNCMFPKSWGGGEEGGGERCKHIIYIPGLNIGNVIPDLLAGTIKRL